MGQQPIIEEELPQKRVGLSWPRYVVRWAEVIAIGAVAVAAAVAGMWFVWTMPWWLTLLASGFPAGALARLARDGWSDARDYVNQYLNWRDNRLDLLEERLKVARESRGRTGNDLEDRRSERE